MIFQLKKKSKRIRSAETVDSLAIVSCSLTSVTEQLWLVYAPGLTPKDWLVAVRCLCNCCQSQIDLNPSSRLVQSAVFVLMGRWDGLA
ncbi:hypothetical protein IAQ61_007649 [Plenodomus lingam]|uniref:uncharacterized protein n=1 Tax=Leptosphaeria maculans TaxID=5022 RepID=UPI00332CF37B|nr:hypothetical protein IAQ61_007649 [Plenodomus lingam]